MIGQFAFQRVTDKSSKSSNKTKEKGDEDSPSEMTRKRDIEAAVESTEGDDSSVGMDEVSMQSLSEDRRVLSIERPRKGEDPIRPSSSSKALSSIPTIAPPSSPSPTPSASLKLAVLVLLCTQNASHVLMTRYSKGVLKETYSGTEVVLVGEMIKFFFSLYMVVHDRSTDLQGSTAQKVFWLVSHSKKIIVLVVLYTIANVLSYQALARVEASVYTVTSQMKIFTTAVFSVLFLGREISSAKWRALSLLVVACILVASPSFNQCLCEDDDAVEEGVSGESSSKKHSLFETLLGVGCIAIMTTISGFSSAYFEGMLKTDTEGKVTIWERNFQLALYSSLLLIWVVIYDFQNGPKDKLIFFDGWTLNTVLIAVIQAFGGLLVAACLKYADSILKVLATAGSIFISSLLGWLLLGGSMDIFVVLGGISTILAIVNYTLG